MKIKRILSFVLMLTMLSVSLSIGVLNASAAPKPEIKISGATANPGDTIELTVDFLNNPGIVTFSLEFEYDEEVLHLDSVTPSSALGGSFQYSKKAVWLGNSDTSCSGTFLTLKFTVLDSTTKNSCEVGVKYNPGDICNLNENDVDFDVTNATVLINNSEYAPTITVGQAIADPGDNVGLNVDFSNNPGISTFSLSFEYDTSRLELLDVTPNSALGGNFQYSKKAVWLGTGNTTYNGTVLTLNFKVLDTADAGDAFIKAVYTAGDICDYDENDVSFALVDGKVSIKKTSTHIHNYLPVDEKEATCTEPAKIIYKCSVCEDSYTQILGVALGHSFGEWEVTKEASATTDGLKVRKCIRCPQTEEEIIPATGEESVELSVKNYVVSITNGNDISVIRYAKGEYATGGEIKRANGCVTLSGNDLLKNVADGIFSREMPDGGIYSFYVKLTDGSEYIFKADVTFFKQELSSVDNNLTVSNLYGVSDIFFCEGRYTTYADVKAKQIFRVTSVKINGTKDYTYAMPGAGEVTVYVKYTDTKRLPEFYYTTITTPNPTITQDGLNITIDDLTNVKCIKRAFGNYSTLAEVKSASGVITYGRDVANGTDSAVLHIPHEGELTVSIQYKSGYTVIKNVTIEQKRPSFIQEGNKVTIGNIDDLYVVRYAKGTYAKANAIKNAPGSAVIRPSAAVDGKITVSNLAKGTYTFLVQYNDESQNYYTVTVN